MAKAPLTVTAPSPTMTYGGAVPALSPAYSGLVDGDTPASLSAQATCTTSASKSSPVGDYPVTCSGASDPNYAVSYVAGTLTVGPAPLSVSAPSPTLPSGGAAPALCPTYSGLVDGDTPASLSAQATCTTSASKSSPVGDYPVTCSGASDPNYAISYVAGTLSITKAPLTVTANDATRYFEAPNPTFVPSYSGFVLGQDLASSAVSGSPTCSTTATGSSPPGTYPITCATGTLVAKNYSFAFVAGTLTVTKAPTVLSATPALMSLSPFGLNLFNLSATLSSEVTKAGLA
ncbi:MAG: MBG domain-containing protein, partial [Acidimicrobiales bacterium]